MKVVIFLVLTGLVFPAGTCSAGLFDKLMKNIGIGSKSEEASEPGTGTIVSALKQALSIGTENAVSAVSKPDGFWGNQAIKILMPEKIQKVADMLKKVGYEKQVDEFILSMNQAAEKAAPKAASYFVDSIKQMTFADAKKILNGGDTAATEYFRAKTYDSLYDEFEPIISSSMNDVGATRAYKNMMGKYESLPFVPKESLDLDGYVTRKSLDGLFYMVGEEEKKIRKDPAARVTDLLKTVFGK